MKIIPQILLAFALMLSACDSGSEPAQETQATQEVQPPEPKKETIAGKWKVTKNEVGGENKLNNDAVIFNFKTNGSFILSNNNEKVIGKWSVFEDNSLIISFFDKKYKTIQGFYEIKDSRLSINGTIGGEATVYELIKAKDSN